MDRKIGSRCTRNLKVMPRALLAALAPAQRFTTASAVGPFPLLTTAAATAATATRLYSVLSGESALPVQLNAAESIPTLLYGWISTGCHVSTVRLACKVQGGPSGREPWLC